MHLLGRKGASFGEERCILSISKTIKYTLLTLNVPSKSNKGFRWISKDKGAHGCNINHQTPRPNLSKPEAHAKRLFALHAKGIGLAKGGHHRFAKQFLVQKSVEIPCSTPRSHHLLAKSDQVESPIDLH